MTGLPYAELHAFPDGDRPHTGNPAGVMVLTAPLSDTDRLGIASSNNLSETAFLEASGEADLWRLRWFTPGVEVDLCGHATMASAVWLFEEGQVAGETARFDTRSGILSVTRAGPGRYAMDLPVIGYTPADPAAEAVAALGAGAPEAAFDIERVHGARYQMLVYSDEATVAGLRPDISALKAAGMNVIATALGASADVVSRFFAPASGVDEDPVHRLGPRHARALLGRAPWPPNPHRPPDRPPPRRPGHDRTRRWPRDACRNGEALSGWGGAGLGGRRRLTAQRSLSPPACGGSAAKRRGGSGRAIIRKPLRCAIPPPSASLTPSPQGGGKKAHLP